MFGNEFNDIGSPENTADAVEALDTVDALDAFGLEGSETEEAADISETDDMQQLMEALQLTPEEAEVYQSFDSMPIEGDFTGKIKTDSCSYTGTACSYTTGTVRCAYTK